MKIYNSLTKKKDEFKPIKGKKVGLYACGPTVYDEPHIGHARGAYIFDVIVRYLRYKKFKVTYVRNVTDVDDKIISKANELKVSTEEVSARYLARYNEDMKELGIAQADIEPKATEHIKDMVSFIKRLIKRGFAYASGGDVYFSVGKLPGYGRLSNRSLDEMESGARIAPGENKKDPLDFALWKAAKEGEPSWESPWGKGRPGWHIECSAMSMKYLGKEFDIHGGGLDLVFPHHENEIAQSRGAGCKFAKYWIHNGLLTINNQKMSKSLGNFISIQDFLAKYSPDVLKFFFLQTHYSHPVDFTWETMEEKRESLERITTFLRRIKEREEGKAAIVTSDIKETVSPRELRNRIKKAHRDFEGAMDEDFNTPNAVAVLFEIVNTCNKVLYSSDFRKAHLSALKYAAKILRELGGVLGITFEELSPGVLEDEVRKQIDIRNRMRKEKNFKEADRIRKQLEEKGIILEDTKEGVIWRRKA